MRTHSHSLEEDIPKCGTVKASKFKDICGEECVSLALGGFAGERKEGQKDIKDSNQGGWIEE
jgi:endogenous inhibitor of DNA gyrase (YacG/DUF329 family)